MPKKKSHFEMGARDKKTGYYVLPEHASKNDNYTCPVCKDDLNYRAGKVNKKHFAHKSRSNCSYFDGNPKESDIHKAAKALLTQMLNERKNIQINRRCEDCNQNTKIFHISDDTYTDGMNAVEEEPFKHDSKNKRADVALKDGNKNIWIFEIKHTHRTQEINRPDNMWSEIDASKFLMDTVSGNNIKSDEIAIQCERCILCKSCEAIRHKKIAEHTRRAQEQRKREIAREKQNAIAEKEYNRRAEEQNAINEKNRQKIESRRRLELAAAAQKRKYEESLTRIVSHEFRPYCVMMPSEEVGDEILFEFGERTATHIYMRYMSRGKQKITPPLMPRPYDKHDVNHSFIASIAAISEWRLNGYILNPSLTTNPFNRYKIKELKDTSTPNELRITEYITLDNEYNTCINSADCKESTGVIYDLYELFAEQEDDEDEYNELCGDLTDQIIQPSPYTKLIWEKWSSGDGKTEYQNWYDCELNNRHKSSVENITQNYGIKCFLHDKYGVLNSGVWSLKHYCKRHHISV